jgi:hypothetical protein
MPLQIRTLTQAASLDADPAERPTLQITQPRRGRPALMAAAEATTVSDVHSSMADRPARPLEPIPVAHPGEAVDHAVELVLQVQIAPDGSVVRVDPEGDAAAPPSFVEVALNAFRSARFAPALRDGHAVASTLRIAVRFDTADLSDDTLAALSAAAR